MEMMREKKKISSYEIMIVFLVGGLFGTVWETIYVYIVNDHLVKRWLFVLPIVNMFAISSLILYLLFHHVKPTIKNMIRVFLISCLVLGVFEIAMGTFLNAIGIEMWNYHQFPLTITDYTTIPAILAWGAIGVLYVMVLPYLLKLANRIPVQYHHILTIIFVIIYMLDLIGSIHHAYTDPAFMYQLVNP